MVEGDIKVYIELIPTEASLKKSAGSLGKELDKVMGGLGIGKGVGGSKGKGGTDSGGLIVSLLKGISGAILALLAATLIVSAFFEAVGPIIETFLKVFTAIILILLAPFLKAAMPLISKILGGAVDVASEISDVIDAYITGASPEEMQKETVEVGGALQELFFGPVAEAAFGFQEFFNTLLVDAFLGPIGAIADMVFGEGTWAGIRDTILFIMNAPFSMEFWAGIWESLVWVSENVFSMEYWEGIWESIVFIAESVFGVIWEGILGSIEFIRDDVFGTVWDTIFSIIEGIATALQNGLNAINNAISGAISAVQNVVSNPVGAISNAIGGLAGAFGFGDFISRPGVGVASFSPDDTIIGMKNPSAFGGGSVVVNNTFNVDAGVDAERLKKVFNDFNKKMGNDLRDRVSYGAGFYA